MESEPSALEVLRQVLLEKGGGTQAELRTELEKHGLEVNQSTISRSLRKLGAIKIFSPEGEASYRLPEEEVPPAIEASVSDLVLQIVHNEFLIVIHTSPGSASLIARKLDYFGIDKILGTVAGDDTVFVAIPAGKSIKKMVAELKTFFSK